MHKVYNPYIKQNFTECDDYGSNKKFFSFIKSKRSDIVGVPPLKDADGITHVKDKEIWELLSMQFASVFSHDDGSSPEVEGPPGFEMNNIVQENGIIKLLDALNHQKASESDGTSAQILKVCSEEVADALVLVFSASINQGKLPDDWRHAIITSVYKGGNKNHTNPENYRPISLTSVTCKLMEHVIHSHIMKHLDRVQTLSNAHVHASRFRKFHSCETQLLQTVNTIRDQRQHLQMDFRLSSKPNTTGCS